MKTKDKSKRNPLVEIVGAAFLGILVYWVVLPPSEPTSSDPDEEQVPEAPPPPDFLLSEEGIKALSPSIRVAKLIPRDEPSEGAPKRARYNVEILIDKPPRAEGAMDWNSVAHDLRSISGILLKRPEPVAINFSFVSSDQENRQWARAAISRDQLPEDWQTLSYLKFFSVIQPQPGTPASRGWLCDFYRQYANARPQGVVPQECGIR